MVFLVYNVCMLKTDKQLKISEIILLIFFVLYLVGWLGTQILDSELLYVGWGVSYWIFAFCGFLAGFIISKRWGGYQSVLGRTLLALAFGLLAQAIGQNLTNYYILTETLKFPSIADFVFFCSVPFYIYGSVMLVKLTGVQAALQKTKNKVIGGSIFFGMVVVAYIFLIGGVAYDFSNIPLLIVDFGYPILETVFVAFSLMAVVLSRNILGGLMRKPMLLLLIALVLQYLGDFLFIILLGNNAYVAGSYNDFIFLLAYFTMTYAILEVHKVFFKVQTDK